MAMLRPLPCTIFHRSSPREIALCWCIPLPHPPAILRAGSAHVLNMWNFSGEHLGATQAYAGMLGQRLSPVASLAFHPHQSLLAHGGADRYVLLVESSARQKGADGFGGLSGYGGATADVVREDWAGDESVVTGYNPLKVPDL